MGITSGPNGITALLIARDKGHERCAALIDALVDAILYSIGGTSWRPESRSRWRSTPANRNSEPAACTTCTCRKATDLHVEYQAWSSTIMWQQLHRPARAEKQQHSFCGQEKQEVWTLVVVCACLGFGCKTCHGS